MTTDLSSLDQASDSLFINRITLRGPEMAVLHAYVSQHSGATRKDLLERFVPMKTNDARASEDVVRYAIDALVTLGLLCAQGTGPSTAYSVRGGDDAFPNLLIKAIRKLPDRQDAMSRLYEHCARTDQLNWTLNELLDMARKEVALEAQWTSQKMDFWRSMMSYCGLVITTKTGFLLAPLPDRLLDWLRGVVPIGGGWAYDAFTNIAGTIAPCFCASGNLHQGWAQSLDFLDQRGLVSLETGSDAPSRLRASTARGREWTRISVATGVRE